MHKKNEFYQQQEGDYRRGDKNPINTILDYELLNKNNLHKLICYRITKHMYSIPNYRFYHQLPLYVHSFKLNSFMTLNILVYAMCCENFITKFLSTYLRVLLDTFITYGMVIST